VRALQVFLNTFEFQAGPIDGVFGTLTKQAVKAFQEAYDLKVNGKIKKPTRSAIIQLTDLANKASVLDPDSRIIGYGASGTDVAELQGLLAVVGHDPGPPDGYFGAMTYNSVLAFQQARGLVADGMIGQGTRAALTELLGLTALIDCDV
jgi:peptidoglycan hydrolase-like protein with peptidoglycan-binding domain